MMINEHPKDQLTQRRKNAAGKRVGLFFIISLVATLLVVPLQAGAQSNDPLSCRNPYNVSGDWYSNNSDGTKNTARLRAAKDCDLIWVKIDQNESENNRVYVVGYECSAANSSCRGESRGLSLSKVGDRFSYGISLSEHKAFRICWSPRVTSGPFEFCSTTYDGQNSSPVNTLPDTTGSDCGDLPDRGDWLVRETVAIATQRAAEDGADSNPSKYWLLYAFYNDVKTGSIGDLKHRPELAEWKDCGVLLFGKPVAIDVPGNIAYGAYGRLILRKAGFSESEVLNVLQAAAGVAQARSDGRLNRAEEVNAIKDLARGRNYEKLKSYDDSCDQTAIKVGFEWFGVTGGGKTLEDELWIQLMHYDLQTPDYTGTC